ncbi:hypothetical protein PV783_20120 [Chitinophaga sp. CC14]|uniref:hypothetical protein n=1 Tax=Chitinophaga TaxID=79328 RepID=UPI000DBA734B|nr:hypothetical protein [Chitinophaga ginsengisegetis]MDR6570061.1 hypothetical protein [Chitinophaga ginsengisegetis]MDR6649795.1 hypothetical protein [Chitinophaga ginsengisegetis]MDR6656002.1 hypothetical protein [Chitinophaga ginsengisegetis]
MTLNAFLLIVFVIVIVYLAFRHDNIKKKKEDTRKAEYEAALSAKHAVYQQALRTDDRQLALKLGREYYSFLRGGSLSVYDEQALTNDLSTMKQQS